MRGNSEKTAESFEFVKLLPTYLTVLTVKFLLIVIIGRLKNKPHVVQIQSDQKVYAPDDYNTESYK